MEETLRVCEDSPIKGETKYCATSVEAMLNFVHGIMREKTQIEALTTTTHDFSEDKSKVLKVELRNDANGDKVEAIAVCHLDTSQWIPSHVSFRVFSILPGTSPVCHFFPSDNLVWDPKQLPMDMKRFVIACLCVY
ncbi:hypothetical protein H5410_020397 [Solanum commersonii]|uniref:BURP domain-containing protein n=1 Tax=Solanum commersonii TaxID=4109 RepID=A0A9J5ZCA9_SOLCO|nr:hypothetical protein H5410_020397 [Solanum commersonii]